MAKFRVKAGFHRQGNMLYRKGEIVKSDANLAKDFPNKFTELGESEGTVKEKKKKKGKLGDLIDKKNGGLKGKDVTKNFPSAKGKALRVIKMTQGPSVGKYNVVKEEDLATPLNPKPLPSGKIGRFVDEVDEDEVQDEE